MARFLADENFPFAVVQELRALGHDVITVYEVGRANKQTPDSEVLEHAISDGRAVLTLNPRDFIREHGRRADHAGIIVCTSDPDFRGQAKQIDDAVGEDQLSRRLLRVTRNLR